LCRQGKFSGTQIHHATFALAALAPTILAVAVAMIEAAEFISLMAKACLTLDALPASNTARLAAVRLTVVAAHTHVENRSTPNT
jgi:hypothetical protein